MFDVALLDLDGVVYIGTTAVAGVPAALAKARHAGMRLAFVTNNASRTPSGVAALLTELGVEAHPGEVVTSAQAAGRYLAEQLPPGSKVLVVGTTGLYESLAEHGLVAVETADGAVAIVQGYSPDLNWRQLAEGAVAIRSGAMWVATNLDPTVPSPRGALPGNGALVAALHHATGSHPIVTGKPQPTMHRETVIRTGAQRPLVVGDRLDTDIQGANASGCASLLVLTGVTASAELLHAPAALRPGYIGPDASALLALHPAVAADGPPSATESAWSCGSWRVVSDGGRLTLKRVAAGETHDGLDALRALTSGAWALVDAGSSCDIVAGDASAQAELVRLGLA